MTRVATGSLVVGIAACFGLAVGAILNARAVAQGWLIAFVFWSGIPIGSLVLLLIHRIVGGRWGDEVVLPANFAYDMAGRQRPQMLSAWRELGLRVDGDPARSLALVVPSGHRGPAFLVGDNFDVILRWNRSESYALAVGLLADRLVGAAPLKVIPPADAPRLSRAQVEAMQQKLAMLGFSAGEVDGVLGPATRDALRRFQQQRGMVADGFPDTPVLQALGVL